MTRFTSSSHAPGASSGKRWRVSTSSSFGLFYEVKWGVLGTLLGATVMRGELRKVAATVLAGLGHHVATGELVGKDFVAKAA